MLTRAFWLKDMPDYPSDIKPTISLQDSSFGVGQGSRLWDHKLLKQMAIKLATIWVPWLILLGTNGG